MTDSPGGQATSTALHLQSQATAFDEGIRGVIPIVVQRRKTRELGKYSFLATLIATRRRRGPCVSMVSTRGHRASTAGPGDSLEMGSLVQPLAGMPTIEYNIPSAPKDLRTPRRRLSRSSCRSRLDGKGIFPG